MARGVIALPRPGRRALSVGLGVLVLSALTAALLPAGPAVARPRRADLAITGMVAGPTQVLAGEVVGIGVTLANVGTRVADTVTVTVTIPPSLQPPSPGELGPAWACAYAAPSWSCSSYGPLDPGQVADELQLHAKVVGGTPGDELLVTAVASTTSRELSTANNTGQASVGLIAGGTIRGTAWIDDDRDGQREPGEPTTTSSWVWGMQVDSEDGSQLVEATISPSAPNWGFTTRTWGTRPTTPTSSRCWSTSSAPTPGARCSR